MTVFQTLALLLSVAAAGACINYKIFKLPSTIGLMAFALLLSFGGITMNHLGWIDLTKASTFVASLDFSDILLHGMLSFLLFAGALHIDLGDLKRYRMVIAVLATVSVAIAAFITGTLVWLAAQGLGFSFPYIDALLFGALIAPTDPVAVMSILKHTDLAPDLRVKIGSESLMNDGAGVVLFIALLDIAAHPHMAIAPSHILFMLLWSGGGGILLGLALGWIGVQTLRNIDDYKIEVIVTLAIASGGYCLGEIALVSAPIAMVAAGLVIGNHGLVFGLSNRMRKHVDLFWELFDEILNGILFLLMGLEMIVITIAPSHIPIVFAAIAAMLIGRLISVAVPLSLLRPQDGFGKGTVTLMTWGGLRGGISIALALSLPPLPDKDLILAMTYVTVVFSILVQGTTFRPIARAIVNKDKWLS